MVSVCLGRSLISNLFTKCAVRQLRRCYSVFGINDMITQEKPEFSIDTATKEQQDVALNMIKQYYLPEHVLVRDRNMDLADDRAFDEYLMSLFKQGNTLLAKAEDGKLAGICVGFASSLVDVKNLRTYAFYRQDPNTKDFLYFTAKLQETPNLWETYKQQKIYEIKMVAVVPEYRRQGLASMLVEASKANAHDLGYHVLRMNCINQYDYKIAERCMFNCVVKYPLHRLRGSNAPFIRKTSPNNCCVRVYVAARPLPDVPDLRSVRERHEEIENIVE